MILIEFFLTVKTKVQVEVIGLTVPKSKLVQATNAVATKQALDDDFMNQLGAHMSWEMLLSPAPLSIGLLGDLMIMSSKTRDFPIDGELPRNGQILYVKYPKSFRTTLVQISNDGHRAFMTAHNNMDKIKLLMGDVPMYMKEATEILVQGDEELVHDYLPAPMARIREAARVSVSLSKAVVWQFEYVMNLTSEVLEMCTSEKTVQEAKLQTNIDRQSILNFTIPSYQQLVHQLNDTMAKDTAMMDRAESDMREALKKMPSGWEMIGMDFIQNIGDIVTTTLSTTLQTATSLGGVLKSGREKYPGGMDEDGIQQAQGVEENSDPTLNGEACIVQHKKSIFNMEGMANYLRSTYKDLTSINSAKNGQYDPNKDSSTLNNILVDVEECEPVAEIVNLGLGFIQKLADIAQDQKPDDVSEIEYVERRQFDFTQAIDMIKEFRASANGMKKWILSNQQAVPSRTPLLSRARQQANSKGSASQQALAACRYKAEMAQATLISTRQSIEKTRAIMIEQNQEFIKLLSEQQKLKLDEIRYDEIIKALQEGLTKLGILKEHWTKLVMFFQKIANVVENVAAKSVQDFANQIDTTSLKLKNIHKQYVMDQLYLKATKAAQASSLVHNMADIYVNVSTNYIMPSVASLSKLIVTDPKTADAERAQLLSKCIDDSNAIVELILAEKQEIVHKIKKRMKDFKKEFAFLDQVKKNQIEALRRKAEKDIQKQNKYTVLEQAERVDQAVQEAIDQDEFLRENNDFQDVPIDSEEW